MLSHVWFFCDPCSPPGSSVPGISQPRVLEWAAISFARGSSQPGDWTHVSCIGRWILDHWATWEAQFYVCWNTKIGEGTCRSRLQWKSMLWLSHYPFCICKQSNGEVIIDTPFRTWRPECSLGGGSGILRPSLFQTCFPQSSFLFPVFLAFFQRRRRSWAAGHGSVVMENCPGGIGILRLQWDVYQYNHSSLFIPVCGKTMLIFSSC